MNPQPAGRWIVSWIVAVLGVSLLGGSQAGAVTTVFFDGSQTTNWVASGTTDDTMSSAGYLFTCTRDKLFTGGTTNPPGRYLRVFWPAGLEAQAVTAGPVTSGAKITIRRQDGQPFSIESFTAKLLANTSGAGGSFEIMPKLNGEDARNDPYAFDATGSYGNSFTYATPQLTNYDAYVVTLYVDYALMSLTVVDDSLPPLVLELVPSGAGSVQLSWPSNYTGFVLQQKSSLSTGNWVNAAEPVTLAGGNYQATFITTNSARYFRLYHP